MTLTPRNMDPKGGVRGGGAVHGGGGGGWLHQRLTHEVLRFPFFFDEYDSNDGARWEKAKEREEE